MTNPQPGFLSSPWVVSYARTGDVGTQYLEFRSRDAAEREYSNMRGQSLYRWVELIDNTGSRLRIVKRQGWGQKEQTNNPKPKFKPGDRITSIYAHLFPNRELKGDTVIPVSNATGEVLEVHSGKGYRGRTWASYLVEVDNAGMPLWGWIQDGHGTWNTGLTKVNPRGESLSHFAERAVTDVAHLMPGAALLANPPGDFEDIKAVSYLPSILKVLDTEGQFYAVMRENGKSISIRRHDDGDITAVVKDWNQVQHGPEVVLQGPEDIQDVCHYAMHYGTLEGWRPDSRGVKLENPFCSNPHTSSIPGYVMVYQGPLTMVTTAREELSEQGVYPQVHRDTRGTEYQLWVRGADRGAASQALNRLYAGRRRNPESTAAEMFETFHGRPSEQVVSYEESEHFHEHLSQLGELVEMIVATPAAKQGTISFANCNVQLACNEEGTQLYIVGGDQSVQLADLGIKGDAADKDSVLLGALLELTYHTEKKFDKFQPTDYFHKAGEETGDQPVVLYDTMNQTLSVSGGAYRVKDVGIVN